MMQQALEAGRRWGRMLMKGLESVEEAMLGRKGRLGLSGALGNTDTAATMDGELMRAARWSEVGLTLVGKVTKRRKNENK